MELLEGQTLAGLVQGGAALPIELASEYLLQACEAVAEAHALGIVHRDLKPGNLFLTTGADGSAVVKVLDFGVSKLGELETDTLPDAVVGSPPYMSPEQLRSSKNVDARTDIWSLGVVLFELVTGRMPFAAQNLHEHYTKLMIEAAPLPTQARTGLPSLVDDIVKRCLARDPADRYANVGELAQDLAKLAPERAQGSVERVERTLALTRASRTSRPSLPAPPIALPQSIHTTSNSKTQLTRRPRKTPVITVAVGLVATLAVATVAVRWRHAPTPIEAAATPFPIPTPSLSPTPIPTPTPSLSPNPTPSLAPAPTPSLSVRPRAPRPISPANEADLEHRK
jgi:serine/threonine protein kinase